MNENGESSERVVRGRSARGSAFTVLLLFLVAGVGVRLEAPTERPASTRTVEVVRHGRTATRARPITMRVPVVDGAARPSTSPRIVDRRPPVRSRRLPPPRAPDVFA